jgi:hypothetical protein
LALSSTPSSIGIFESFALTGLSIDKVQHFDQFSKRRKKVSRNDQMKTIYHYQIMLLLSVLVLVPGSQG